MRTDVLIAFGMISRGFSVSPAAVPDQLDRGVGEDDTRMISSIGSRPGGEDAAVVGDDREARGSDDPSAR